MIKYILYLFAHKYLFRFTEHILLSRLRFQDQTNWLQIKLALMVYRDETINVSSFKILMDGIKIF